MKSCHMMAKISTSSCNVHGTDCFYLNKEQFLPECKAYCMDDTMLQLFIRQKIEAQESHDVIFTWQGVELTPDRLNFFKRVIALQQQFAQGKNIFNTLLTNGILLDDDWCEFFRKNQFLIGISVDGDVSLYNNFRKTISGKSMNHPVEKAVRLLQKHDVEFHTLTVISARSSQQPLQIYNYLKSLGSNHMQFIPLLEPLAQGGVNARSLAPAALGTSLKTIFYTWIRLDIGTIKIPIFEHAFAAWCGLPASNCAFASFAGSVFSPKINDDLCQCDRFVNPQSSLSNKYQSITTTLHESVSNQMIMQSKLPLVAECASCKVKFACHGGCPKDRIVLSRRGVPELNYFCESYQAFFTYVEPYMLMMRALWEQSYAPSDIRQYLA